MAAGIVRYTGEGGVSHLPLSLAPWKSSRDFYETGRLATLLYNRLYHGVTCDTGFLQESLAPLREADPFVASLFDSVSERTLNKPCLYLSRSDFMPVPIEHRWVPKQIEMNLMAVSLGCSNEKVDDLLRSLYGPTDTVAKMPVNNAGTGLAETMAEAYRRYADSKGQILFIVPPGEVNAFDQRTLHNHLTARHGVPVRRTTLEEVHDKLETRGTKAIFEGREVVIAYFRAGYSPAHYTDARAWKARKALEASDAICVPNALTQLANTKKMQQVLFDRQTLLNYVGPAEADCLLDTQVALTPLDRTIQFRGQEGPARELALRDPGAWVLKPSREGGGNNYFGTDMVALLKSLDSRQSEAYILMELVQPPPRTGIRLVEGQVVVTPCVTEFGHFTGCLYEPGAAEPLFNRTFGSLQRTKDIANDEGLVLGGFSFLDCVTIID